MLLASNNSYCTPLSSSTEIGWCKQQKWGRTPGLAVWRWCQGPNNFLFLCSARHFARAYVNTRRQKNTKDKVQGWQQFCRYDKKVPFYTNTKLKILDTNSCSPLLSLPSQQPHLRFLSLFVEWNNLISQQVVFTCKLFDNKQNHWHETFSCSAKTPGGPNITHSYIFLFHASSTKHYGLSN